MTLLSSSYGIIMDFLINAQGHGNNFFHVLNEMDKRYLKGKMELIGKLAGNDTKNIGTIPNDYKRRLR